MLNITIIHVLIALKKWAGAILNKNVTCLFKICFGVANAYPHIKTVLKPPTVTHPYIQTRLMPRKF